VKDESKQSEAQAVKALRDAGYSFVEREKRLQGSGQNRVCDLVAWGAGLDGEFKPQVSVEIKSRRSAEAAGLAMALAQLSAYAANLGTPVNLVYIDGEWLQADAGFMSLTPIDGPPECPAAEGIVRNPEVLRQLLNSRVWDMASEARHKSHLIEGEALRVILDEIQLDDDGFIRGLKTGVLTSPELFIRTWLTAAGDSRDFTAAGDRHYFMRESVTASEVTSAMVQIAEPQAGDVVFDPFAGFGGLLLAAATYPSAIQGIDISGNDINPTAHAIAQRLLNLLGHGGEVRWEDSTVKPWPQADIVMSTPPIGIKLNEATQLPFGQVRDMDVAAIAWAAEALKPGGRAVLLTSRGWTFRSGDAARLRSWLAENYHVAALIGLPSVSRLTTMPMLLTVIDKLPSSESIIADLTDDWQMQLAPSSELTRLLKRR